MTVPVTALMLLLFLALAGSDAGAQQLKDDDIFDWEFEGEYEVKLDYQKDFTLDNRIRDDLLRLDQELQLRSFLRPNDRISLLLEAKVLGESELYANRRSKTHEFWLERGETWFRIDKLFNWDLRFQIGRQNYEEPRRWWWDDDLDAVRLRYRRNPWLLELGVAQELVPTTTLENFVDPEEQSVLRVLGRAEWSYLENHRVALFSLYQNDRSRTPAVGTLVKRDRVDPSDATLLWGGLRAMGKTAPSSIGELSYWADTAIVMGREKVVEFDPIPGGYERVVSRDNRRVRGWAFDLGGRWSTELTLRPMFTLGYAIGSGDPSPATGTDRAFRQTRLQSVDEEFRTYGELLRPELSNLSIPVLSVQFPLFLRSHVEFAYRHFRQVHAAPFVREGRLETEPNGIHKNIGQEWMIYFGIKEWKNTDLELVGAVFRAGNAYGNLSGHRAYTLFLKVTYEF